MEGIDQKTETETKAETETIITPVQSTSPHAH